MDSIIFFFPRKPAELQETSIYQRGIQFATPWQKVWRAGRIVDHGTSGSQGASKGKKWTISFDIQLTFFHYLMKTKLNLKSLPFWRVLFDLQLLVF